MRGRLRDRQAGRGEGQRHVIDGTQTVCYRPCLMTSLPQAHDTPNLAPPPMSSVAEEINEKIWCRPDLYWPVILSSGQGFLLLVLQIWQNPKNGDWRFFFGYSIQIQTFVTGINLDLPSFANQCKLTNHVNLFSVFSLSGVENCRNLMIHSV